MDTTKWWVSFSFRPTHTTAKLYLPVRWFVSPPRTVVLTVKGPCCMRCTAPAAGSRPSHSKWYLRSGTLHRNHSSNSIVWLFTLWCIFWPFCGFSMFDPACLNLLDSPYTHGPDLFTLSSDVNSDLMLPAYSWSRSTLITSLAHY